ncbi:hypothetical protein EXIGLDRAFT_716109 [Exidia glandulosa HHB12029]|uniref:Golgi apparatus membrane protein TVP38 n=1 Tax=Exidia glandulosa HHB12029 TaxID=1314781 RepID=A0A165QUR8_EXIGL|nr:hypothetical protein EXIGLDRAFT_716109 [Exidia glandulosa HHB12029]
MADRDDDTYRASWAAFPLAFAKRYAHRSYKHFQSMRTRSKLAFMLVMAAYTGLMIAFFVIGPKKVSHSIYTSAQRLRAMPFGWAILMSIMTATSIPPAVGFTTTMTLCGFVYGLQGFAIAGPGMFLGSAVSFILLRVLFRRRIRTWANDNASWRALGSVIRAKGMPLICLIRLCPLPWTGSNMLFASIETVSFVQFMLATTVLMPKCFIAVFIGARLALLSDGEHDKDGTTKLINWISICVAMLVAVLTGVYVWRVTRAEIEAMEELDPEQRRLAEDAVEDLEEAPFVEPPYSD